MCVCRVHNAKKLEGVDQIYLPGERGDLRETETEQTGTISVSVGKLNKLREMAMCVVQRKV